MDSAVLPAPLADWCTRTLGAPPVERVFSITRMATVVGVRLADGNTVVIKARDEKPERVQSCVAVQRALAMGGFPCPKPLTDVAVVGGLTVHAEQWRPGGDIQRGDGIDAAQRSAYLLSDLIARAALVDVAPPLPTPVHVRWDHDGEGVWAPEPCHDALAVHASVPEQVVGIARRVRARLRDAALPPVIGHADWETHNLRWRGGEPYAVYDWDSLGWLPEAALAGSASGSFASAEQPTLASMESSASFLDAYERARGRRFSSEESQVAWAASLWLPAHNARMEVLYAKPPLASVALADQAPARLALAGA